MTSAPRSRAAAAAGDLRRDAPLPVALGLAGRDADLAAVLPAVAGEVAIVERRGPPARGWDDPFDERPWCPPLPFGRFGAAVDGESPLYRALPVARAPRRGLGGDDCAPFTRVTVEREVARLAAEPALLAANPPPGLAVGGLHLCELLAAVAARSGRGLRIDLGWLLAHQVQGGHAPAHRLESLLVARIEVIVLAPGAIVVGGVPRYDDARGGGDALAPEALELLDQLLGRCPDLRALLLGVDGAASRGDPEALAAPLALLARRIADR